MKRHLSKDIQMSSKHVQKILNTADHYRNGNQNLNPLEWILFKRKEEEERKLQVLVRM